MTAPDPLAGVIEDELRQGVPDDVAAFAAHLAQRYPSALAVLYYGSNLRTGDLTASLLDFYLIVDRYRPALGSTVAALANRLLPPNVYYAPWTSPAGTVLRCKYAVLSARQLAARCRATTLDVSIWARFAQPIRAVWWRNEAALEECAAALADAVRTAYGSIAPRASALEHWSAVFERTYRCELRAERPGKGQDLASGHADRFAAISPGLAPGKSDRPLWWFVRRWVGRAQHLARLIKASMTFTGGIDYLAWKITRHSGVPVTITPWQRRHPILGGASLLAGLLRRGAIR